MIGGEKIDDIVTQGLRLVGGEDVLRVGAAVQEDQLLRLGGAPVLFLYRGGWFPQMLTNNLQHSSPTPLSYQGQYRILGRFP